MRESKSVQGTLLATPAMLWMIGLLIVPLILIVVTSFGQRDPDGNVIYTFSLHNYIRLAGIKTNCGDGAAVCFDSLYLRILVRSVGLALATTLLTIVLGYPLAYYVARAPARRRNMLLFLILIPLWTNFVIRVYAWIRILRAFDLLYTPQAVLVGMVYEFIPFMILPMYTSLEKIDPSLYEAAADLGANSLRTFLKVTLPLSLPGVVAGTLLVFVPVMGTFVVSDILGGKQFELVGNLIQGQFLDARDPTFGSAASVILMGMTLIVMIIYTRKFGFGEEVAIT
ncbi:Spermidine/putrescine transport system permease protein PotB [Thermoflexales bacterium]|nr:Spermidine/putrescine transport system permease protein PotB [Thermoflexales bacterium]